MHTAEQDKSSNRVLARRLARELTTEEISKVSGGCWIDTFCGSPAADACDVDKNPSQ